MTILGRFLPAMQQGQAGVTDVGRWEDSEIEYFGTGDDFRFRFDGTNMIFDADAGEIQIDSEGTSTDALEFLVPTQTTGNIINIPAANSLTTGKILNLVSNSADTGTRDLVVITNDNTLATGARCLVLQQDAVQTGMLLDMNANGVSLLMTSTATTSGVIAIQDPGTTSGISLDIAACDALTTGKGLRVYGNGTNTSTRAIVQFVNDNTLATGATVLELQQDAAIRGMFIDMNGTSGVGLYIDQDGNSASRTWAAQIDGDNAGAGGPGGIDLSSFAAGEPVFNFVDVTTAVGTAYGRVAVNMGASGVKYLQVFNA